MVRLHQLAAAAACLRVALGESYLSYTCDATGCSCNVGFYGQLTATTVPHTGCTMCPAYATTAAAGSATVSLCLCRPGYTAPAGGLTAASKSCAPCATDTFKVARGNAACTACPAHSSTLQASGATSRATCQCDAGFTGDLSGVGTCQACAATEYKLIPGPAACTAIVDCAGSWAYTDPACTNLCQAGAGAVTRAKVYSITAPASPQGAACPATDGQASSDACPSATVFRNAVDRWVAVQVTVAPVSTIPTVTVSIEVTSTNAAVSTGLGIDPPIVKIDGVEVPLKTGAMGGTSFTAEREQTNGQSPLVAVSGLRSCAASGDVVHEFEGTGTRRLRLVGAVLSQGRRQLEAGHEL